jgi:preprotein translocase subunit SecF
MNTALNATLARTVMTTMTVFLVTASLFFLGGKGLEAFSFCVMIGFLSGVYSTVYIASALVLMIRRVSA